MPSLNILQTLIRPTMRSFLGASLLILPATTFAAEADWHSQCGESQQLQTIKYQGCLDSLALEDNATGASITGISYLATDSAERPVMFFFNGGPGASSSMLHFDGIGPKQKHTDADGNTVFIDNPRSLLKQADLVFIDPPGTGLTQQPSDEAAQLDFWSSAGDAKAFTQFIRQWLVAHHRTEAKIYIGGESYGGYRLALMAADLNGLNVGGLMFISPLLDASDTSESAGNVLSYMFNLPSMVIAAAHYQRGSYKDQPLEKIYQQVTEFSYNSYGPALMLGAALPEARKQKLAQQLADMLGVTARVLLDKSLKLGVEDYRNMLLAGEGDVFGRLDTRVVAPLPPPRKDKVSALDDPALGLKGGLEIKSPLYTEYLQQLTGTTIDVPYKALNLNINYHWQFAPHREGFGSVAFYFNPTANLAQFVSEQPKAKLLILGGYYDLAVPAQAIEYAVNQANIPEKNLTLAILKTGHSVFADEQARPQLDALLQEFLK